VGRRKSEGGIEGGKKGKNYNPPTAQLFLSKKKGRESRKGEKLVRSHSKDFKGGWEKLFKKSMKKGKTP